MKYKSEINGNLLWSKILTGHKDWTVDGTDILMGNGQSGGIPNGLGAICKEAIDEIRLWTGMRPRHVMVNRLPAGCIVPVHIDPVLDNPTRFHLPLITNIRHCYFWDEFRGFQFFDIGTWYEVDYRVRHSVGNLGTTERVHLIVDLI